MALRGKDKTYHATKKAKIVHSQNLREKPSRTFKASGVNRENFTKRRLIVKGETALHTFTALRAEFEMHLAPLPFSDPDVRYRICTHPSTKQPVPVAQKQPEICPSLPPTHFCTATPGKQASGQCRWVQGLGRGVSPSERYGPHRSSLENVLTAVSGDGARRTVISHALHPFGISASQAVKEGCTR